MTFRLRSLMLAVAVVSLELFAWTAIGGDLFGDVSLDPWSVKAIFLIYLNAIAIILVLVPAWLVSLIGRLQTASGARDRARDATILDDSRDPTLGT